jgi:DNA-directed RNA polymerase sigma subunit (sigma70/sigma32)
MTDRTYPQTLARVSLDERREISSDAAALHFSGRLNERAMLVLAHRAAGDSHRQIAAVLGCSRQWVRQIEVDALATLNAAVADQVTA